jgi:hypothetical protein
VRKKKEPNPKIRMQVAIGLGVAVIAIVILVNYYLDQTQISGQRFGDQLAQIQTDLKNVTLSFDAQETQYNNGNIPKIQMLKITDDHIKTLQSFLPRYDQLKTPDLFVPSLQLFRLSTETEIERTNTFREWIVTGDNATKEKSDELFQQAYQYEMSALTSYENAKSKSSQ